MLQQPNYIHTTTWNEALQGVEPFLRLHRRLHDYNSESAYEPCEIKTGAKVSHLYEEDY